MKEIANISSKKNNIKTDNSVVRAHKAESFQSRHSSADRVLHLQRTIGNQAVQRMVKSGTLQTKLKIGQPGDKYEQEADRVAEQVMRMPEPKMVSRQTGNPSECPACEPEELRRQPEEEEEEELIQPKPLADQITPLVQRQVEGEEEEEIQAKPLAGQITPLVQRQVDPEEEEEEEELQAKATSGHISEVTPNLESHIQSFKGGGQPLPESSRAYFEPRFGRDFSQVRVHTDTQAAESARAVNAKAFTTDRDVVFGAGQYSPETSVGQRLLAHELSHVVQQQNLIGTINRKPADACPSYQPAEARISHSSAGHLEPDVIRVAPGRLLIADFGVNWRSVKRSARNTPLLRSWLNIFESDDSYRLSIKGYSDCVGAAWLNTNLRQGRALRVEQLLGPSARSRVVFRGMAGLGTYFTNNNSAENRAKNRGVIIEFRQEFTFPPEEISATPRRCGPDVAQWLVNQMNVNRNHPTIRTMREVRWPRYVPFFNIGWTAAALYDFVQLVRGGGAWDFKSHSRALGWRAGTGRSCPTTPCDLTLTMCGMCFNYDVPGNIHFGWIGRAASLRSWLLHFGAGIVQPGRWTDDPKDAVAVAIGEAMWDNGAVLCAELRRRRNQLNLDRTENCSSCS